MSSQRPRILLLSPAFPPSVGGIERTAGALAEGLSDYDVQVVSGLPSTPGAMASPPAIRVHWAANEPPYGRRATAALLSRAIRVGLTFRPALVLALHIRTMPAAQALRRLTGARVLLVIHAKEMTEQPALAQAAVRWSDALVAVSGYSRELALAAGADPERIQIVHPGVTLPDEASKLSDRADPPTVITVARMNDAHKGHDVALGAASRLRERLHDFRWILVGDGRLRPLLREKAQRLGLDGTVEFPGAVEDQELERLLSTAHAFCLLSRRPSAGTAGEGFGIAFVEAGAHGLPVVAGKIEGVVDAVQEGVSGLLVDPTDPQAVARALERLLVDRELAQRLADGGRARAEALAWPKVIDSYRWLIEAVLAAPPRGQRSPRFTWIRDLLTGPLASA